MKQAKRFIPSAVLFALFLILIVLLNLVDVAAIGPEGTKVGLSHLNNAIHTAFGFNMVWYMVTKVLGFLALLVAVFFTLFAILQIVTRKSLTKVDRPLLALVGLYVATAVVYVFFEIVVVNYRPVIMPGEEHVEASFPSSHVMLACVIFCSAFMVFGKYVRNEMVRTVIQISCISVLVVIVLGRLLSGVHWLTDVIGGILISATLLTAYVPLSKKRRKRRRKENEDVVQPEQAG